MSALKLFSLRAPEVGDRGWLDHHSPVSTRRDVSEAALASGELAAAFLYRARCLEITQFVPTEAIKERHKLLGLWRAWLDLWSFEGEVIGDDKPRQPCPCDECEGIDPVAASNHLEER